MLINHKPIDSIYQKRSNNMRNQLAKNEKDQPPLFELKISQISNICNSSPLFMKERNSLIWIEVEKKIRLIF
jgi:hypothetical protein